MTYLLDTNACISYLNNAESPVRAHLEALKPDDVGICSVVEAELLFGVLKSARPAENQARLKLFLKPFESLPFDSAAAAAYARIRLDLTRTGTLIGPNDLLIAAIAIANNMILVTRNQKEFLRVADLCSEDWEGA